MDPTKRDLDTPRRLTAGALAGLTSVAFTYPLDIVRTRLSIQSAQVANTKEAQAALPGIWKTMVLIYTKERGVIGLYRGLGPTLTVRNASNLHSVEAKEQRRYVSNVNPVITILDVNRVLLHMSL
jgi:hypothetical protein